jgi:hypothetical protein
MNPSRMEESMSKFEDDAFLQLLNEIQARLDAEADAKFEAEYDADIAPELEAARQERLQWERNRVRAQD